MSFRSFSVQGATIRGVEAVPVSVEVVISNGLPGFGSVPRLLPPDTALLH